MKCTKCNAKEATVFYRENINGKETKYALCGDCAAAMEKETGNLFADPFGGNLLGSLFSSIPQKTQPRKEEKKCSLCGATFRQLAENGKVGCPTCYVSFREELAPTLKRLHGTAVHRGRTPEKFQAKRSAMEKLASLEKQLKQAIETEAYEEAATLRDQIRALRGQ